MEEEAEQVQLPAQEDGEEPEPESVDVTPEKNEEIKPQEPETTEAVKEQKQEQTQPQPQNSGWGSWGSWISSTVNSVVESSSKIVQDLTTAVEEEEISPTKNSSRSLTLYRTDDDLKKEEEDKNKMDLEDKIIHSTTEVSGTTNYLSSVINKGVSTLQHVDIEGIRAQAESIGKSTVDISSKIVSQTVESLGTAGDRAKEMWTDEASDPAAPSSQEDEERKEAPVPTFPYYFDEFMGNIHLQALELLSTECTMKVQEVQRKCDPEQLQNIVVYLQMIADVFEGEGEEDEDNKDPDLPEKAQAIRENMKQIQTDAEAKISAIIADFKEKLASHETKEEPSEGSQPEDDAQETINLAEGFLNDIHQQELAVLAHMSASAVELINRTAENWVVQSQQEQSHQGEVVRRPEVSLAKANCIESLSNSLADEISSVSMNFVQACRTISAQSKKILEQSNRAEFVASICKTQINTIYADTGDAIAKVHESKEFALPVLQWVYILAESDVSYAK
mmetsp:Transcript_4309/g.5308  ORF Transcript_4309/g.5308 Transcript_4309/m.5308 type:complete len:506 (-) Transcript_4309:21-1538(-)